MSAAAARAAFEALSHNMGSIAAACEGSFGAEGDQMFRGIARAIDAGNPSEVPPPADRHPEITRRLQMSWALESQLRMRGRLAPELRAHVLHGIAPEAYYAVYHAARAYVSATCDPQPPDKHRQTLDTLSAHVVAGRMPGPLAANVGGGYSRKRFDFTACEDREDLAAVLATTRVALLRTRAGKWRERNKKPRLSPTASAQIVRDAQATTVFDVFLRHRERANYRDASAFLDSEVQTDEAEDFFNGFRVATASVVTTLNILTARALGKDQVLAAAGPFLRGPGREIHDAVAVRVDILQGGN